MAMGKSTVGRNIDSRTRLLNSLGMFQAQQRRDEGKCCHGSLLPPRKDGRDGSNPRKDCRDVSPNTNHLGGDKKKNSSRQEFFRYSRAVGSPQYCSIRDEIERREYHQELQG
mmetsp:Transcript_7511/g.14837  ORF Transcript_7511/g.14837 Transcript_7511/m.14837 type:complete len:112 (-) Transcript_7511:963-1298(-)